VTSTILDEVLFLDPSITNFDTALRDILLERDVEIVSLDSAKDGVFQVAEFVRGRKGLKVIHLLCPGDEGSLSMGNCRLSGNSISNGHRDAIKTIGQSLARDAEIRIYNRTFNPGHNDGQFVNELSNATGAFVIVNNSKSTEWLTEDLLDCSLTPPSSKTLDLQSWGQLLPPLKQAKFDTPGLVESEPFIDSETATREVQTELAIKYEFDQAQAAGWLCVGFASGCATALFVVWCGLWI
jgi:hypothetical protein